MTSGEHDEMDEVLTAAHAAASDWIHGLGTARVAAATDRPPRSTALPEVGVGAAAAFQELVQRAKERATASTGPRYFHYVLGGVTPAALAADWFATALDQVASSAQGSPLAVDLEELATGWLVELFQLGMPEDWTGVFTTGATMANFVGLGAARQWWGDALGVDVAEEGLAGLPRPVVLTSGFVHASVVKSLAMLGIGRASVERFSADNRGALDLDGLAARLEALGEQPMEERGPAIVVATAGEVNAGGFDPIESLADLCEAHGAWLHVDGAFGLFARASESARPLCGGAERADSIATDGHKWLNVPYDCGVAFVRKRSLLARTFRMVADYLPKAGSAAALQRVPANLGPESSRRARALPVFATLLASGRSGVAAMVDEHLRLAVYLANRVRECPDLELLEEPCLNVVPFRLAPAGVRKRDLDALNEAAAAQVLREGLVFVGTTRYRSRVAFRPAIANWRTREADLDLLIECVLRAGDAVLEAERG
ncbi:L-2,4-diaminobutyrate decarboxylase [Planctomycetes bacterium Poly30]|uniref:L-2,4-diaminobutyrate decarboxylase n=1 Tax=Saltatorellus ferox TaxID=2528018 RepID=A0A518EL81_9BACT|nr:L-2,4-diaminobutyrate decarboxylase [Planctomycetes bacterium Poly30]